MQLKKLDVWKQKPIRKLLRARQILVNSIKDDVADLTVSLASKILSQQLDTEKHSELIDRYIDKLGDA